MQCRSRRTYLSLKTLQVCQVLLVLFLVCIPIYASGTDNVVVRHNVSKTNREELARRLRTITGWSDLTFNADGALRIGTARASAGSSSARDLINRAVSGRRVILFEDASSRKDVVFCRVVLGRLDHAPTSEVHVVLIDFSDFRQVTGDKQARAAFDVGWAVLHEMDHVVEDSEDPQQDIPGDCEGRINRMRLELGVPVRNSYFFTFLPIRNDSNLISRFVRLSFDQDNGPTSQRKRYWLVWDAALVGGLTSEAESARASFDIF